MTTDQQEIIDAAIDVAIFSKTNEYPKPGTPAFFLFTDKLDRLATKISNAYRVFNRNVPLTAKAAQLDGEACT